MNYRELLLNKPYFNITVANALNRLGDSLDVLLFTWLIYDVTKNASYSAFMVACNILPSILLQPIAGVFVENINKRQIMYVSDFCRCLFVFVIFLTYCCDQLNSYVLLIITILISSVEAFRVPSGVAIIPSILDEKSIDYGVSFSEGMSQCFELLGVAIGGGILALLGIKITLLIDLCIFFISAIFLLKTKVNTNSNFIPRLDINGYSLELKNGLYYFLKNNVLCFLCILGLMLNMVMIPINSLQAPFVVEYLHNGPIMLSVIGTFSAISMIIGSFVYPLFSKYVSTYLLIFIGGLMCCSNYLLWWCATFLEISEIKIALVVLGTVVGMFGLSIISNCIKIIFVKEVDSSFLARMSGLYNSLVNLFSPLIATLIGVMVTNINLITILLGSFVIFLIIFILLYLYSYKNMIMK